MSRPTKRPLVIDGVMAPERDHRLVPASTMALYEECHPITVYRRALAGVYPAHGMERRGSEIRYRPSICLAVSP